MLNNAYSPIHVSVRSVDMQFIQDCSVNQDSLYQYFRNELTTCLDKMLLRMHVLILFCSYSCNNSMCFLSF